MSPTATPLTVPSPAPGAGSRCRGNGCAQDRSNIRRWFSSTCDGVSDLVRGRSALFLSELEEEIEVLDPANTVLVPDTSRTYNDALLYLESHRRRSIPNDELIHLGHRGVMNLVPYQLDPALQALKQPRARILIADATGLGKDARSGDPRHGADSAGTRQTHPRRCAEEHAHSVPEGVVDPFLDPLVRLDSVGLARSQSNPGEPQSLQSLRPEHHLDRHAQEQPRIPQLPRKRLVGHHRHRRVPERSGTSRRRGRLTPRAPRPDAGDALRHVDAALGHAARRVGSELRVADVVADPIAISDPDDYTPEDFRHKAS